MWKVDTSSRVFHFEGNVGRKGTRSTVPWILLGGQSGSRQSVEFSLKREKGREGNAEGTTKNRRGLSSSRFHCNSTVARCSSERNSFERKFEKRRRYVESRFKDNPIQSSKKIFPR